MEPASAPTIFWAVTELPAGEKPVMSFGSGLPNAKQVCVVGEFNFWNPEDLPMERLDDSVWEVFTTRGYEGCPYKYYITRPGRFHRL